MRKEIEGMLFTIFAEVEGGTYIQQVTSSNVDEAFEEWFRSSVTEPEMTERDVLLGEAPKPVDEVQNVWCCSFCDDSERFFLVHIVQTSQE